MRLAPATLLWRTFLLVSLVITLSVAAWFWIYTSYEREPRARQLAQFAASAVNLTRAALISAQPERRHLLLLELSDSEGIMVYPAEDDDVAEPLEDGALMQRVAEEIRHRLGTETRLAGRVNGIAAFWVSFVIDGDDYWLALPGERLARVFPWGWVGWGGAALALSLAAAYLTVSRVSRPLHQLAQAAASLGRGEDPPQLSEAGPSEIATVARAFNRMAADLRQLDTDRALILAGVSHDLRTPLARLRLAVEMTGTDAETRAEIVADIDEIDQVIGQFLDFARASGGEPPELVDADGLADELATSYQRRGSQVELAGRCATPLRARPRALRRLITNLVENALRHGGAPVQISWRREAASLLLDVSDRGPGIPPDQVERLKRPFTRLDESRAGMRGAGLGLAIVERLARAHGGSLDLLPRDGGGTIARVRLPIGGGEAQAT